jgi:transcriptional regulator with XRE-family HTH domain
MPAKNPTDIIVGRNIRHYRMLRGLSQQKLASGIGVTFQQLQKYESGQNRVGAGRLMDIARILKVPVDSFFEGAPKPGDEDHSSAIAILADRANFRMVQAFSEIGDAGLRRTLLELVEQMAARRWRLK